MSEITLKKEEAHFLALQSQALSIAEACNKLQVTDETTLAIATQNLSKAQSVTKQIEAIRTDLKAPYLQAGKQIDALAKKLAEPIEDAVNAGKKKILAYNAEVQRKKQEEANRIQKIRNAISEYSDNAMIEMYRCATLDELREVRDRLVVNAPQDKWGEFLNEFLVVRNNLNEYAKSRKIAITQPEQSDEKEAEAIAEVIQETSSAIGAEALSETAPTKLAGARYTWAFEVENIANVPMEWLTVDEAAVKEYMKLHKDNLKEGVYQGIRFFQRESLTIR